MGTCRRAHRFIHRSCCHRTQRHTITPVTLTTTVTTTTHDLHNKPFQRITIIFITRNSFHHTTTTTTITTMTNHVSYIVVTSAWVQFAPWPSPSWTWLAPRSQQCQSPTFSRGTVHGLTARKEVKPGKEGRREGRTGGERGKVRGVVRMGVMRLHVEIDR